MPTTTFDYLIIGQGLAGSILAHTLITLGCRVLVIDKRHEGASSKAAAGIINPITGPRLSNSNDFNDYFITAKSYYAKLEYHIKKRVFHNIEQIRQIQNASQHDFLKKRLDDPHYQSLISLIDNETSSAFKKSNFPTISIKGTAVIDTNNLLHASKCWLTSLNAYQESTFNYAQLISDRNGLHYQGIHARHIIFCEGYQAIDNPWLTDLPFKLAKGEILTVTNDINKTPMMSWDKWLVPQGAIAKLGSNFAWDDLDLTPSEEIKTTLINSLQKNTDLCANVISHEVGIRPSTRQREPFIGKLSNLDNAYCFNGFGSKGCLLIPHYADLLSKHLLQQSPLPTRLSKWL